MLINAGVILALVEFWIMSFMAVEFAYFDRQIALLVNCFCCRTSQKTFQ